MRPFLTRLALISMFLLSLLAAGSAAALAAPGNGATQFGDQINVNDCETTNYTYCFTARGEYQYVTTATGSFNGQANFDSACLTVYEGGVIVGQFCLDNVHVQLHTDSTSEVQVFHLAGTLTYSDGTNSCSESARFQLANGQLQYGGLDGDCL